MTALSQSESRIFPPILIFGGKMCHMTLSANERTGFSHQKGHVTTTNKMTELLHSAEGDNYFVITLCSNFQFKCIVRDWQWVITVFFILVRVPFKSIVSKNRYRIIFIISPMKFFIKHFIGPRKMLTHYQ